MPHVPCSRHYQCRNVSRCAPPSDLVHNNSVIAKLAANTHVQFWGNSLMAQAECDFRSALSAVEKPAKESPTYGHYKKLGAISEYVQIGCPWHCSFDHHNQSHEALNPDLLLWRAKHATHIVFNIGAHYEARSNIYTSSVLNYYEHVLRAAMHQYKVTVVVRSPTQTHFDNAHGQWSGYDRTSLQCRPVQQPQHPPFYHHMQGLARRLGARFLDLWDASDEYSQHSDIAGDCLHFCQNCPLMRLWTLMLAPLLT